MLAPGTTLQGRYAVVGPIAKGGMEAGIANALGLDVLVLCQKDIYSEASPPRKADPAIQQGGRAPRHSGLTRGLRDVASGGG